MANTNDVNGAALGKYGVAYMDTTDLFNSPFKKTKSMFSIGGVLEVAPNEWLNTSGNSDSLVYKDSTVYFWRCSPNVLVKEWNESSFQYINGKWGWGQSHFFQYKKDDFLTFLGGHPVEPCVPRKI